MGLEPLTHSRGLGTEVRWLRPVRWMGIVLALVAVISLAGWAAAALYVDFPVVGARWLAAAGYASLSIAGLIFLPRWRYKLLSCVAAFAVVLAWWLTLAPSNDRHWQPDVAMTAWAEIDRDHVTIHNVRNFDYRTETEYTPHWETRSYDLADLRGVDLFVTYWGSPWIAHPIASFQFGDADHVAISIETRKEVGEEYSAIRGFFRQYELIYVVADERDVIRLRSNYRTGEDVYLFRTEATPAAARALFLSYLESVNELHQKPTFYNAVTSNCTTNIRVHTHAIAGYSPAPWDWRLLLSGKADEFAYQYGRLAGGLPFDDLKRAAHINGSARGAGDSTDFSSKIRRHRPGFDES